MAQQALVEIRSVFGRVAPGTADSMCGEILNARRIACYGVGREGLMMKALSMRLMHLGLDAHVAGDMTTPPVGQGDLLIASAGPGSFTGLRVGLTTVKAWAEIYGKPIAAVSRLESLTVNDSQAYKSPTAELFVASYIDARREQVFAALYARLGDSFEPLGQESVTSLPDFVAKVQEKTKDKPVRWVTPDPEMLESLAQWPSLAATGHIVELAAPPFAQRLGFLAYRKFRYGDTTDALALDANYVRRSDAEVFWKGNKSALKP